MKISASKRTKIKISVMENANDSKNHGLESLKFGESEDGGASHYVDCRFVLINPKDPDSDTNSLVEEVLNLYMKELPAMNYAANTGKQSSFLQRCVSNGKFCTLILIERSVERSSKVIAATTYQIIPADTQYAEIPLAAVSSTYQHKGFGRLLYVELRKRLQDVGISTILCWGDKESEGFWHKQGFVAIAEVGTKVRARRLPIRPEIRRALCFPGCSTLMVSHLTKIHDTGAFSIKVRLDPPPKTLSSNDEFYSLSGTAEASAPPTLASGRSAGQQNMQPELNESNAGLNYQQPVPNRKLDTTTMVDIPVSIMTLKQFSSTYTRKSKQRVWETSSSSLNSKRVKATHLAECQQYSDSILALDKEQKDDPPFNQNQLELEENAVTAKSKPIDGDEIQAMKQFNIMLMDLADGPKKAGLTKIIVDLGGAVTVDGSLCTHVLTGKVRKTLNFCTALCSGAWILSPNWLKESSREGRFVNEFPFILKDEDYQMKFRVDLQEAVLRSRENPKGLLHGYSVCLSTHVQPPVQMLSAIVRYAGGDVTIGLEKVGDKSTTIFIACEDDMEEALLAVKRGLRTFSSDWLMNCIMKQELELDAPQFAESL